MGLSITWFRGLTPYRGIVECDEDGDPYQSDVFWLPGDSMLFSEENWPGRGAPLMADRFYTFVASESIDVGSYNFFGEWRDWLATLTGFPDAATFREQAGPEVSFYELMHFADNAGVIGSKAADILYDDFLVHAEHALTSERFGPLFQKLTDGCEMAAQDGALLFH